MADLHEMVRSIRRKAGDKPDVTRATDATITTSTSTLTLPTGHVSTKFPRAGGVIEFDDGSGEKALVDAVDPGANTLTVLRGWDGTEPQAHAQNVALLSEPRYDYAEIVDAINYIVDVECWPNIWSFRETSLTYQSGDEFYSPSVSDIEEIVYAYQVNSGEKLRLHAEFMSPAIADDVNFPYGAIIIRDTWFSTTIYLAYRAKLTVSNLSPSQEGLVKLGAVAHLLMLEEAQQVAPGAGQLDRRVSEGATIRAGALLWQRFEAARAQERINLLSEEAPGTVYVRGRV